MLAALTVGVLVLVNSLTGNDADGQTSTTLAAAPVTTAVDAAAAVTTVAAAAGEPAAVAHTGPPTDADPARILVVGDSDAGTFAPYLERLLDDTDVVDITLDYKVSSGLARPDFYDWPASCAGARRPPPDIVIATFGGNDSQGLSVPCPNGSPSAEWVARQIAEAFPWIAPTYLIRDRDGIYGAIVTRRLRAMGIRDKPYSPASPWQNGYVERLIGSIRRECLDQVIVNGRDASAHNSASLCRLL